MTFTTAICAIRSSIVGIPKGLLPPLNFGISTNFTALAYNYRSSCNSIDNKDWNPNFAHKCSSLTINAWTTLIKLYFLKGFKDYSFVYLKWFCFLHCVLFIKLRDTIRWIRFPLRSPSHYKNFNTTTEKSATDWDFDTFLPYVSCVFDIFSWHSQSASHVPSKSLYNGLAAYRQITKLCSLQKKLHMLRMK